VISGNADHVDTLVEDTTPGHRGRVTWQPGNQQQRESHRNVYQHTAAVTDGGRRLACREHQTQQALAASTPKGTDRGAAHGSHNLRPIGWLTVPETAPHQQQLLKRGAFSRG
jgi:hypothetical protein